MNKYDYNKHYTLRELCNLLGIQYNQNHPKLSLNKIKMELELHQISKQKYRIVRELSYEEKAELRHFSNCKQILEPTIYYLLSKTTDNKIRDNMKGYFERFHITNEYYKYFAYENITEKKLELLEAINFGEELTFANMVMYNFVTDTHPIFRRMVLDTFHKMVDESYIVLKEHLMFGEKITLTLGTNELGEKIEKQIYKNKDATIIEEQLYTTIRRDKMEYRKFNEWSKVPFFVKQQIQNEILHEMGKHYMYYEYEIILNKEGLQRKSEEQNLENLFNQLNVAIAEKIVRSEQGELKNTPQVIKKQCSDKLIKPINIQNRT